MIVKIILTIPKPTAVLESDLFSEEFAGPVFAFAGGGVGGEEGIFSK
jgi:hypothetical protein